MSSTITLRGVRAHNLKNIDVEIPLHRLTVVTGVSGAGKSSLVFDTLYAEAQRRYLQSFSVYTRQFLERFDKPDAKAISDLPPAIAIRPSLTSLSPRQTVGSLTELDAPLRLLFAQAGIIVCPQCQETVKAHRGADVVAHLQAMPAGTRAALAFPSASADASDAGAWQAALREEGYVRVQVDGAIYRLDTDTVPPVKAGDTAWVIVDRVETGKTETARLTESVEAALRRGAGRMGVLTECGESIFDQRHYCVRCQRLFPAPEPRLFDADDPLGACQACRGAGRKSKSNEVCPACQGRRFGADALAVRVDGQSIAEWRALPLEELRKSVAAAIAPSPHPGPPPQGGREKFNARLSSFVELQLGHLSLETSVAGLDHGVAQRISLAAASASNLVNVLYLIAEPTVGVHPSEVSTIADALIQLRDRGNTVVVVENQRAIVSVADHVIDLGPGAGEDGGSVTYQGPPSGLTNAVEHPTSDFWTGRSFVEVRERRRKPTGWLKLADGSAEREIAFPLGVFCVVTGPCRANKRALVEHSLYAAWSEHKGQKPDCPQHKAWRIHGANRVSNMVLLDHTALTRSARSNPATYLKVFDEIRDLFAQTTDAKIRNYGPGHFSFNQPGGRCETCAGEGALTIDMQFLADVRTTCPECQGRRYRKEILAIKVRSLSIAEVLSLTAREAFRFFRAQPAIERKLKVLLDVGLDYLRLGQSVETLSGSECQRLKLAGHLATSRKTGCVFLLIEPSAGLHPADVVELVDCFERLLAAGHSLIAISHDLDVIKSADWVIELGPGGEVRGQGTPEAFEALNNDEAPG